MLELMNQMDTQENIVKVDLLNLDPTDPGLLLRPSQRRTLLRTAPSRTGEPA